MTQTLIHISETKISFNAGELILFFGAMLLILLFAVRHYRSKINAYRLRIDHAKIAIDLNAKLKDKISKQESSLAEIKERLQNKIDEISDKEKRLKEILALNHPLSDIGPLYVLCFDYIFTSVEAFFRRNSLEEDFEKLEKLKKDYSVCKQENILFRLKFKLLDIIWPNVSKDLKYAESINAIYEYLKPERYSLAYWLPKGNYTDLDEAGLEQAAVDAYISSKDKTQWELGSFYELYIGEGFRKKGYDIVYSGLDNGIHDMGRDIIAKKGQLIYIIQCKYWRRGFINENVIMQIYGSAKDFSIYHQETKVIPVVYTTANFSETAKNVANRLGVKYKVKPMGERCPCIKCNINNRGQKIYHLPFDRDYSFTKIFKKGEFYATTVKEARDKGFSRAYH